MNDEERGQVIDNLLAARELIADEDNWCTGHHRRVFEDGHEKFCAVGAIARAKGIPMNRKMFRGSGEGFTAYSVGEVSAPDWPEVNEIGGINIITINDCRGHEDVLKEFDITIERLKNES